MPRNETARPGKRPLRSLSALEKMEAIKRVHDGESKAAVARDIGVPESTLRGWCKSEHKIRSQAKNLGTFEQVSSPSDSDRSTPSVASGSNLPVAATQRESTNEDSERKRLRAENGSATAMTLAEINGQLLPTCHTLYNFIGNSEINKNIAEHLVLLQKQNSLMSMFSASPVASASPVGLIENGLQYTRSNGIPNNIGNKRKHSISSINSPQDISRNNTKRQNSLSPATEKSLNPEATSTPSTSGLANGTQTDPSTSKTGIKQDGKTLDQIALHLGMQQYAHTFQKQQQQLQQSGQTNGLSLDTLVQWYKVYSTFQAQFANVPSVRNFLGRQLVENYICNNNNVHENNNETGHIANANTGEREPDLNRIINYTEIVINWLEHHGSALCTFTQLLQLKKLLANMKEYLADKDKANKKEPNPSS